MASVCNLQQSQQENFDVIYSSQHVSSDVLHVPKLN